jgi:hypothetical protein
VCARVPSDFVVFLREAKLDHFHDSNERNTMQSSQTGAKRALSVVASIALAFAGIVGFSSAAHAADAGKVYLNFEASDTLGAGVSGFEGATTTIEASPAAVGGIGGNGDALKVVKAGNAWAGLNVLLAGDTPYRYAPASSSVISFDYYAEIASPIMVKLEGGGSNVRKTVEAAVGWNHFDLDMSTGFGWDATKEYVILAIFPDFTDGDVPYTGVAATAPAGQIFWLDSLSINGGTVENVNGAGNGAPGVVEAVTTLVTFETGDNLGAQAITGAFEGAATDILDAPAGGNGGKALRITKAGNAWSGVNLFTAPSGQKFLDATHKTVTLNYFSPETVNTPVQFQVIGGGSTISQAVEAVPGWQKLTFDFSATYNDAKDYTQAVIFPNFVNTGDVPGYTGAPAAPMAGKYYFVDNIAFNGATTPAIVVPRTATSTLLTFETSDTLGGLAAGDADANKAQGGFEGLSTSIADAPTGGNGGKALKMVKNQGAQTYAGVNLVKFAADTRVTDGTNKVITMNYYSAKANSTVRLEVRPYPAALGLDVTATKVGWQRLTFDFTNVAGWTAAEEFVGLTLFPDFNVAGANTTYYVDDVAFNGATTPVLVTPVVAVKPALRTAATVAGTAKVGKTLTAGKGSWTGTATIAYTYKWYRCTVVAKTATTALPASSAKCSTISGATKSTYKLAKADIGKYVRVLVTAKNSKGYAYSLSKSTTGKVAK